MLLLLGFIMPGPMEMLILAILAILAVWIVSILLRMLRRKDD